MEFTEENISRLFGHEAAEDEEFERLQSYYIKNNTHKKLTADLPLRILVGHKGVGKSAIFTIARHEDEKENKLSVLIKPDDISKIGQDNSDFSQMIRDWKEGLLSIIASKVFENLNIDIENTTLNNLLKKGSKIINLIKETLSRQTEEINFDGINKSLIEQFLKDNRIIVYIDDLDRGWQSKKNDIQRISALLNAVRDLSNDNKGLRFRISLRTDVYYLVRTSDESTDKIESSVVWHKWSNHEILILLVKRIETFFGRDINVDSLRNAEQSTLANYLDSIFEKKFTDYGKWSNVPIHRVLMSLIRNRPRDLVKLCTLAAKVAYENCSNKIKTEHLKAIFPEYSQGRIQDTINEYKSELPEIERLLLNMKPSQKEVKERIGYIYDTNRLKRKISNIQEQGKFTYTNGKTATENDLIQFLYKINFITARKKLEDGTIERKYFEENRYISSPNVDFGFDWEIHPAFRWALSPNENDTLLINSFDL